jgi:hypothetical protein
MMKVFLIIQNYRNRMIMISNGIRSTLTNNNNHLKEISQINLKILQHRSLKHENVHHLHHLLHLIMIMVVVVVDKKLIFKQKMTTNNHNNQKLINENRLKIHHEYQHDRYQIMIQLVHVYEDKNRMIPNFVYILFFFSKEKPKKRKKSII